MNNNNNIENNKIPTAFTAEKAGMKGLDQDKINEIITNATKNTKIHQKQQEEKEKIKHEVEKINKDLTIFHKNSILYTQIKTLADSKIKSIQKESRFDKIWFHIDMDMFFAAIEIRNNPELENIPIAIGDESMISTSNYVARKFGVRSAMPGFIGKLLCPNLKFINCNHHLYMEESDKIMNILSEYDNEIEIRSCDEAYLDMTNYLKNRGLKNKEEIINVANEIKNKIFLSRKLTCSIGIACNKKLAKICSDQNKPNGIFYLDFEQQAINDFLKPLNIRKIPFIGPKTEIRMNFMNIFTVEDVLKRYIDLFYLNEGTFEFFIRNCFGIGGYFHCQEQDDKSYSKSISFQMTNNKNFIYETLKKTVNSVLEKLLKMGNCKTIAIEVIDVEEKKISKGFTKNTGFLGKNEIFDISFDLINELLEKAKKIRMIRFRVSNLTFYNNDNKNDEKSTKGNKSIFDYIQTLKDEFNKQENNRILIGINQKTDVKNLKKEKIETNDKNKNNNIKNNNKNNNKNNKKSNSEKNKRKRKSSKTLSKEKLNKNNIDNSLKKNKKQRNSVKCVDILNLLNNMKQFK